MLLRRVTTTVTYNFTNTHIFQLKETEINVEGAQAYILVEPREMRVRS